MAKRHPCLPASPRLATKVKSSSRLSFCFSENNLSFRSHFVLDLLARTTIITASRSGKWRVAIVLAAWRRGADGRYDAGPGRRRSAKMVETNGDERRRVGRTVQVHVRATVRTNGERVSAVTSLGHAANRKIHPRAERRRGPASVAGSALPFCRTRAGPPPVCRESGMQAARTDQAGAEGAVNRPVVPHAPSGR